MRSFEACLLALSVIACDVFSATPEKIEAAQLRRNGPPGQPIPPPLLLPFADNRQWVVFRDIVYYVGQSGTAITIPRGFVTDFASIPEPLWSLGLSPNGLYSKAAIVHDYLYWSQGCTKAQADNLLVIAMKESRVGPKTTAAIFAGVFADGESSWKENGRARASGQVRIIPESELGNIGPLVLWDEFREALRRKGVVEKARPEASPYCALGDSKSVP